MDPEALREFCLSMPCATEDVQWENDLLFRIGGKMFAVLALEPSHGVAFCFKCTPEEFADLTERPGIVPAPYLARYHWVGLQRLDALSPAALKKGIEASYRMVRAKLPKRVRAQFEN